MYMQLIIEVSSCCFTKSAMSHTSRWYYRVRLTVITSDPTEFAWVVFSLDFLWLECYGFNVRFLIPTTIPLEKSKIKFRVLWSKTRYDATIIKGTKTNSVTFLQMYLPLTAYNLPTSTASLNTFLSKDKKWETTLCSTWWRYNRRESLNVYVYSGVVCHRITVHWVPCSSGF